MRIKKFISLFCLAVSGLSGFSAERPCTDVLRDVAERLSGTDAYCDSCIYEVLLPSYSEPVRYRLNLESLRPEIYTDTLAPCSYLINWELDTPSGTVSTGFSAYFNGDLYRFRDKRLQEYHAAWDIAPFRPMGKVASGVQNTTQFTDLLPQFLGRHFKEMIADTSYCFKVVPDSMVNGEHSLVVDGVRRVGGYDVVEYTYILDPKTALPRRIEFENNPGQISEQSVDVRFFNSGRSGTGIDVERLKMISPEAFGRFRESAYALETLPGRPFPRVSARRLDGERFLHGRGETFVAPTLFVFLDTQVATTRQMIDDIRAAVVQLPLAFDVVWTFLDKKAEDIGPFFNGDMQNANELVLMNGGGMARECGIGANVPVLVFCSPDGNVSDVINGYNKDLVPLVIQKAMLAASAR